MKTATKIAAQGDVIFRRVPAVPPGFVETKTNGAKVVAHSETGHHHVVEDPCRLFEEPGNPLVAYLQLEDGCTDGLSVIHQRPWDTHETIKLLGKSGDVYEVRRQREWTPEGWQRVND